MYWISEGVLVGTARERRMQREQVMKIDMERERGKTRRIEKMKRKGATEKSRRKGATTHLGFLWIHEGKRGRKR
jgi:hypothetical protein